MNKNIRIETKMKQNQILQCNNEYNTSIYDFAHIVLAMNPVCVRLIVAQSGKVQNAVYLV